MSEGQRITISIGRDGELSLYLNEDGRDVLVQELQGLSRDSDHVHLGTFEGAEVELRDIPYAEGDTIVHAAKILLRPDDWDREYFPHVLSDRSGA
jgi:hypothetical protein